MADPDAVLYLVRHGRTMLNASGALRGRLDPPLDEIGLSEAQALAQSFTGRGITAVVSSPLLRARQTAQPIADACGVSVGIDARLADRDYGPWAGTIPEKLRSRFGSLDDAPDVETAASLLARALAAVEAIVARPASTPTVIVAHDAVNRALLHHFAPSLGDVDSIPQRTGCWNRLDRSDGRWLAGAVNASPTGDRAR
jgi:glucosyl-3-phosphoglycerate phosphatase